MSHKKQSSGPKSTRHKEQKSARQSQQAERLRRVESATSGETIIHEKVVKIKKYPNRLQDRERRENAKSRLKFQLQSGTSVGNIPLTEADKKRIENEIKILESRLK